MIEQNSLKPIRKVGIADHLWAAFDQMAQEMGSDRDALVNQAMFMFARLNGFLNVAQAAGGSPSTAPALAQVKPAPRAAPEPDFDDEEQSAEDSMEADEDDAPPEPAPPARRSNPPAPPMLGNARPRSDGPPVLDGEAPARRGGEPAPRLFTETPAPPPKQLDDDPVRREVAERVLETAAELERLIKGKNDPPRPGLSDSTNNGAAPGAEKLLYLSSDDGELLKVSKERFLIGRGKHCDFVINSGKVSREHAAVVRDSGEFFLEDLGSSNGTWFNKQRIKRRKIEDGDEFFICSEKIRCLFR